MYWVQGESISVIEKSDARIIMMIKIYIFPLFAFFSRFFFKNKCSYTGKSVEILGPNILIWLFCPNMLTSYIY
jgi:hypothetical protein